jgi:ribosomal protein L9
MIFVNGKPAGLVSSNVEPISVHDDAEAAMRKLEAAAANLHDDAEAAMRKLEAAAANLHDDAEAAVRKLEAAAANLHDDAEKLGRLWGNQTRRS